MELIDNLAQGGNTLVIPQHRNSRTPRRSILRSIGALLLAACWLPAADRCLGGDLGHVPLFDGERNDALNLWGGPFNAGNIVSMTKQSAVVRSGTGAYRANLAIPTGGFGFFQTFSSAVNGTPGYRQDRDLTQYQTLEGYVRNDTAAPLTFALEIKDYRDSNSHRARRSFTIPAGGAWTKIEAPLSLASGWTISGSPDLTRTFALSFTDIPPATGSLYLDDFALRENGPSIDPATAPIETVVERLAHRQFHALWASRNKTTGIIPNSSDNVVLGALNTTTGVVWTLPSAVRRGWVAQADADAYMGQLVNSLNVNRNQTTYLPTRFLDLVTASPNVLAEREESSIDAAFIALALHNYKSQPATPVALRDSISTLESRFDFSAFVRPTAFNHAYFPATGFAANTYSGFTNENKVITLAAQLADAVPLAGEWNKDTGRVLASLVDPNQEFLTYSFSTEYRAQFAQALLNLFVDTSDRGVDNYANRTLARNPWINYVRSESEVSAKLEQQGREFFFQPDAGAGAGTYKPWNLFQPNNFGQPDIFQPWSAALALLAGAEGADDALRFLLDNGLGTGLDGPQGLADSAIWAEGSANPSSVPSFADNWNMALSTMALMEYLDGDDRTSRFFADLPEVKSALDTVFLDGDLNGNGVTNAADLALWKTGLGTAFRANPAGGDADGDGDVDGADFLRWQRGYGGTTSASSANRAVPEPHAAVLGLMVLVGVRFGGKWRLQASHLIR